MEPTVTETAPIVDPGDRARPIRRKVSGTGREPVLPGETQDLRRAISQFVRTGRVPASMPFQAGLTGRLPALVYQAATSRAVRTPYPVILEAAPEGVRLRPLGTLMDELAASAAGNPETADLNRHFLGRIEATLRADPALDPSFSLAWKNACDAIEPGLRDVRKSDFKSFVAEMGARLPKRASLLPCEPETARMAARAVEERLATERGREIVLEADTLRASLLSLLEAEHESSHDAVAPDRLRRAVGGAIAAEINFDALSHLLDEAPHAPGLVPDRKVRIEKLVADLGHASTFFSSEVVCRLDDARDRMDEQSGRLADLLRALESARLEVVNRYRPELHDELFEGYDADALSADDLDRCPPVLVEVDEATVTPDQIGHLVSLLADRRPFKVLLTLRSVPGADTTAAAVPSMVIGLGTAFVAHVALSDLATWSAALERGLAFRGPALFAFHAGAPDLDRLSPYLAAAVARDGRAVPSFVFDPTPGSAWVDRMDVSSNEQPGQDWLSSKLRVESADGGFDETTSVFTWLDSAACEPAFDREFLVLDPAFEPRELVQADQYLAMSAEGRARSFPYVMTVTPDGELEKAVVTARLAERALLALDRWRRLRELGSVDNSFAARAQKEAAARYQADQETALAAARSHHAAEMDRAVSALAESIVANIAANLLDLEPGTAARVSVARPALSASVPAPAAVAPVDAAPAPAPVAEPEEEPLVLDEAYIETPRCTSCNECVQLNGMIFAYNAEKQAYIKNAAGGPFRDLVMAAEKCPVRIIHPGKPANPAEPGLEDLLERARVFR